MFQRCGYGFGKPNIDLLAYKLVNVAKYICESFYIQNLIKMAINSIPFMFFLL